MADFFLALPQREVLFCVEVMICYGRAIGCTRCLPLSLTRSFVKITSQFLLMFFAAARAFFCLATKEAKMPGAIVRRPASSQVRNQKNSLRSDSF
jgi:hypothetical protein